MPKIKNMCGVAYKPVHKGRDQRHHENHLTTQAEKTGLGLVNFLAFSAAGKLKLAIRCQVLVICLAVLMVPTDVWAGLTSLSLDANGDSVFRGKQERLNIVFTVDDSTADDGDTYTVTANQHLIRRGTVSENQSVRISWDGHINNRQLPDGNYTISVVLSKAGAAGEVLERSATAILDTTPPRLSSVFANEDPNLLLTNGSFVNVPVRTITVIPEADEGSAIDFAAKQTNIVLKNARGVVRNGSLNYTTQLSFSLGNPLDIRSENGSYTLTITLVDKAGNLVQETTEFTFDNVAPNLVSVAGNRGAIAPGSGVSLQLNFVEATLEDNFENGVNLSGSTIRLTGPEGEILGRQTFPGKNKIRWVFLSPLLPKDGFYDGGYTVEVVGTDNAGNQSGAIRVPFVYDNLAPQLISLSPTQDGVSFNQIGDTIYHNQPLTQIVAVFNDGDAGIGVDFGQGTRIQLSVIRGGNTTESLPGRTFVDRTNTQITYVLDDPLVNQDGSYRLNVQFADTLGNTDRETFLLLYDTQLPTLVSTVPAANETVDNLSQIRVVLNETASGIDFIQSSFRLTRDVGGTQIEVPVNITNNGTNVATLTVLEPIALDGSDDGTYVIEVTPTDQAGNVGAPARREFYLVSQTQTEVRLTIPEETTVADLETVAAGLTNYIGTGINFKESTLTVTNPQGAVVPERRIETDGINNLLTWSTDAVIPRDGTADGEYTITATFVDFSGKRFTEEFSIFLDTQFPAIESVRAETRSQPDLSVNRTTDIAAGFSQIIVTFAERAGSAARNLQVSKSDVDFVNTSVTLVSPAGEDIPVNRFDNGQTTLTLNFQTLTQPGEYVLSITPQDLIGNRSTAAFVYRFHIDVSLPAVSAVLIDGKIGAAVYVNGTATAIEATFTDPAGVGLDLGDGGSTITVTDPNGVPAPGVTTRRGTDGLRWVPVALPTDGTADGRYTVAVTPMDRTGRQGETAYRQLVFDTQEPRITASTPVAFLQPVTYIGGALTQLQFTIEDVGPAGLNLEEQAVSMLDTGEVPIAAAHIADEINGTLYLTLDAPFARDGSMDGEYMIKISLVDRAGNPLNAERKLVYDSQVPRLSSVTINTAAPMELPPQQLTEILEPISGITFQFEDATRVDFDNTVVTLAGPNDVSIPLTLQDDGKSQLTASFPALHQVGMYTLSVIPRDIAGNVTPGPINYPFALGLSLPSVSSIVIGLQTDDVAYLNADNVVISATFLDPTGTGLAFDDDGSSIVVTNASGVVVPGQTQVNGNDQLVWEPIFLPTDNSVDGRYTVEVTPIDKLGRHGDVVSRQFIYDTATPRVIEASPLILSDPVSYIPRDFRQFVFTIEDVGPADLFFQDQVIALVDAAGDAVPTTMTFDELTSQLYLTLTSSFPRDGSADGEYAVKVSLVDKAGNRLDSEYAFVYDSRAPQLTAVTVNTDPPMELVQNRIPEILEPISNITLKFEELTRIDFSNTVIELVGPDEAAIPLTLEDDGVSEMVVDFLELTRIGSYTLTVTTQDIAGNAASGAASYEFVLDVPLPSVDTVVIGEQAAGVAYVNANNIIIVANLLDPTETGLDFSSEGSVIQVQTLDGAVVPGLTGSNGVNLIGWEPAAFTSDGTTDGRYSVYVIPIDKAGRQGNTVYREFIYDTQEPQITSADPVDLSQPVSYISDNLTQFRFSVEDIGPADLELSEQEVRLLDANGNPVPAQLTNDTSSEIFLTLDEPLSRDGSMDGEYTVRVALADKSGNTFNIEHLIVYDTQAPTLVSTVPADGALVTADRTQIQVTLNDAGDSGIDWDVTTVTLVDPNGSQLSGELVSDGVAQLTLNTNQLIEDGRYIIRVQAVDRAGNGSATVFERSFLLSRRLPAIVSTSPTTAPADEAFTNEEVDRIEVLIETDDENHLSTLRLLNTSNQVVAGQQMRESDRLVYNLVRPLAVDGSDDGVYTIEFTPISASGRAGEIQLLTFTHDTEVPEIEPEAIDLVVTAPEVNNSLTEIRVTLTDEQSGIDWENVDEEWLMFERLSPNPTKISGRVEDDNQSILSFRLTVPLADNGSADGEYRITVTPQDRAGNGEVPYEKVFTYDTSPPMIDTTTLLLNEVPLLVDIEAENYPTAVSTTGGVVVQANMFDTGLGVNLAQSRIVVRGPDGTEISGNTQQNGVDTLLFKSDGLPAQGLYQVTVVSIGNDSELLGFAPTDSITTVFLYETTVPTAALTADGGETELTDKALPLEGTASDPTGTQQVGEGEMSVPASGVWLVEIVGTGPDNQPIDPVPAVDDSNAEQDPWSVWSIDFLPTRSGEYDLDVRVTDNAGNYEVYNIGEYTMSVSLTFREPTFGWPNPLRISRGDVAFFSFDVNVPLGETVELTLSIYDWSGDMILSQTYPDVVSGQRNDQLVKWNLENQAGNQVARGLYIFRLQAINAAGNSANAVGKVLVVE